MQEHLKGLRGYSTVHFHIIESEKPLPTNIKELLTQAYKDLSDSLFNEMAELGRTNNLLAAEEVLHGLLGDVLTYLGRPDDELTEERVAVATVSFGGLSELLMLVTEFEKIPDIKR
ncbi:MAG: hypothetical protein V4594_00830 [Bacteroidota bacterium]